MSPSTSNLVADLRLLLAELLENATNFSPPGTRVAVGRARRRGVRHRHRRPRHRPGSGAARGGEPAAGRAGAARHRPTTMLGLFVVGRLARRHGLSVRLEQSEGRGITATVRIPDRSAQHAALVAPRSIEAVPRLAAPQRQSSRRRGADRAVRLVRAWDAESVAVGASVGAERYRRGRWSPCPTRSSIPASTRASPRAVDATPVPASGVAAAPAPGLTEPRRRRRPPPLPPLRGIPSRRSGRAAADPGPA